jgi:hypothetical protein
MTFQQIIQALDLRPLSTLDEYQAILCAFRWWLLGWALGISFAVPLWIIKLIKRAGSVGD